MKRKVTRLYTGPDGESHFEDIELHLECKVGVGQELKSVEPTGVTIWQNDGKRDHDWHNAPRRQFLFTLEGECEMEIGDGTKRRFGPGDILLVEDTTGRGHVTRAVNKQPRKAVVVPLD